MADPLCQAQLAAGDAGAAWASVSGVFVCTSTAGGINLYITGVTSRARKVEETNPPMITQAMGEYRPMF